MRTASVKSFCGVTAPAKNLETFRQVVFGTSVPIEDIDFIEVPDQAAADRANATLDQMLRDGRIAEKPGITVSARDPNIVPTYGTGAKYGTALLKERIRRVDTWTGIGVPLCLCRP